MPDPSSPKKLHKRPLSAAFGHAFDGLRHALRHERNFQIHVVCAVLVVAVCAFFRVEARYWLLVGYAVFGVWVTELVNTALEAAVDLFCENKPHPLAKIAKDCAAAAVLLAALQALVVAGLVARHIFVV